ncbi:MAG TPA: amino acid adenylation domain-containing protein, partial [Ktedonobacteraceae bacterium]|nr:amino acid adenylation domain-containing protein [Ktedonobacteraceae bacterium]
GYTAPSIEGQSEVIAEAQMVADVHPETITYIEAHGTATPLGDPIEIAALTKAFRQQTEKKGFCALGSVKTNIGHLDTAAGVAGLIKTVLALKHALLPPSLHFEQPNPQIDFANSPFYVNTQCVPWKSQNTLLRAGVSSFGIGGTNAHVILEEAPMLEVSDNTEARQLLLLSAKTRTALQNVILRLSEYVKQQPDLNLADVAYTLQVGRKHFDHRLMCICRDVREASHALARLDITQAVSCAHEADQWPVVFLFPGQGAQYVQMGRELYLSEPTFKQQIDLCAELLMPVLGVDVRAYLYPDEDSSQKEVEQQLHQTWLTQPALFIIEYALAHLWMKWGVRPQAMIGHSIGEYVAACLAGVFNLKDALTLVAVRGQMLQRMPVGAMLAVPLAAEDLSPFLGEQISLAAINGPRRCVVSGPLEAIADLEQKMLQRGLSSQRLRTSHAFHSSMLDTMLAPFAEYVKRIALQPPRIPYISNVTGTWITATEATSPVYWVNHVRQTVRFEEGIHTLLRMPHPLLLEVGPGQTLSRLVCQYPDKTDHIFSSLLSEQKEDTSLLETLGKLWMAGVNIDWQAFAAGKLHHRIPLPTYPFERKRYWLDPVEAERSTFAATNGMRKVAATQIASQQGQNIFSDILERKTLEPVQIAASIVPLSRRRNKITLMLREMFANLFGIALDEMKTHRTFFEMGADSLFLLLASQALQDKFAMNIPFRHLFEELATIDKLAEYIDQELTSEELLEDFADVTISPENVTTSPEENREEKLIARVVKATIVELQRSGLLPPAASSSQEDAIPPLAAPSRETVDIPASGPGDILVPVEKELDLSRMQTGIMRNAPLTEAQRELWFITQLGSDAAHAYNQSMTLHMRGPLHIQQLREAIQQVVARHEALRTTFSAQGDYQRISQVLAIDIPLIDFSSPDDPAREMQVSSWLAKDIRQSFDLENGPLFRCHILKLEEQYHQLILTYHHLIVDGWSIGILMKELGALYSAACQGTDCWLPEPMQCSAYAYWQLQQAQGVEMKRAEAYWLRMFSNPPPTLELPTDYPRPSLKTYTGARESMLLNADLCSKLRSVSVQQNSTLFMLLLASFNVLLYRLSAQEDFAIAILSAGQVATGGAHLVGHCVNLLPLRSQLTDYLSFTSYLASVKNAVLDAYNYHLYPFSQLVKNLKFPRDPSQTPLISTLFNLDQEGGQPFLDLDVDMVTNPTGYAKFDLSINILQSRGELHVECDYNTDLFDPTTIQRWLGHFQVLLEGIVVNSGQCLSALPLLSQDELYHLLRERNATQQSYPKTRSVHQLIEEQLVRTPDAIAVVYGESLITYHELDRRANQLAFYLRTQGIRNGMRVGICMERSLEMMIALVGILKAGGAFLPLDPGFPQDRMAYMLADGKALLLLTQQRLLEQLPEFDEEGQHIAVLCLDRDWSMIAALPTEMEPCGVTGDDLAYVMYTSGSTGRPKGVLISHFAFINYLYWCLDAYGAAYGRGAPMQSSIAADAVFPNLFSPLFVGTAVFMLPESQALEALSSILQEQGGFSLLKITPTQLEVLNLQLPQGNAQGWVRTLIVGAEALRGDILNFWQTNAPDTILLNEYGPTETVVGCSIYRIRQPISGPVPIGLPIANIQFYVLDSHLQIVPIGVPGELYIGGDGLAWGYLNRPDLTAQVFIPHPFTDVPGARLYKTGDIVRYLPDAEGNIEFIGRRDHQVKIRGYRVELGEIEALLVEHPAVEQSAALIREDTPGDKRLVAYVIVSHDQELAEGDLRAYARGRMPDYMVPSAFVFLDVLPLTTTGKIDLRALPAPQRDQKVVLDEGFVVPRTPAERILAQIWERVLGLERVGIYDNFFMLGGDSITSIRIVHRARESGLSLIPKHMFQHQTIAELATVAQTTPASMPAQDPVVGSVIPTPIQRWFFECDLLDPHHCNQAMLLEVHQPLNLTVLEQAAQTLLVHHDILRLRVRKGEAGWLLINNGPDEVAACMCIDLTSLPLSAQSRAIETEAARLQASLDLAHGPLVRWALFKTAIGEADRLLIVMHHLLVDIVSWKILLEDLQTAYKQARDGLAMQLAPKTTSYQEWARQLMLYATSARIRRELDHWLALAHHPRYTLPLDHSGINTTNTEGSARTFSIVVLDAVETSALVQTVTNAYHIQVYEVLLAALVRTFAQWTGQAGLQIDLEGHGREPLFEQVDLSRTVGWFTALFPVYLTVEGIDEPGETLKAIKEQLRQIPNKGIGYGILRYLSPDGAIHEQLRALPQSEVIFNYQGRAVQDFEQDAMFTSAAESPGPSHSPRDQRKHLLEINVVIFDGCLRMYWTYSTDLHQHATIEKLARSYGEVLHTFITHCQFRDAEKYQYTYTPSDFPEAQLSPQEVETIFTALSEATEWKTHE